jgi:hypothetical protein
MGEITLLYPEFFLFFRYKSRPGQEAVRGLTLKFSIIARAKLLQQGHLTMQSIDTGAILFVKLLAKRRHWI